MKNMGMKPTKAMKAKMKAKKGTKKDKERKGS